MAELLWFGGGLLLMTLATVALAAWARVSLGWLPLVAMVRAVVQLSVVALILRGVLSVPALALAFVVLMLSTASFTSGNRIQHLYQGRRTALFGVIAGAVISLSVIFALRLVEREPRYLIAVAGIVVGNAMSAATLSGRNFLRDARAKSAEIEGWLALGATPTEAHQGVGRLAAREALLPTLDQTKSTGLVTLPGAFVGALFGGASPVTAAQFQLVVLAGIAMAMLVTSIIVTRLAGRNPRLPVSEIPV